jgi:hypothetical protein
MPTPIEVYSVISIWIEHIPDFSQQFWSNVRIGDYEYFNGSKCLFWKSKIRTFGSRGCGRYPVQRIAYILHRGKILNGCPILHLCGNNHSSSSGLCINPRHLQAYSTSATMLADYNRRRQERQFQRIHMKFQKSGWEWALRVNQNTQQLMDSLTNPQPAKEATA